ncbi:hypothetical protein PGT21_006045 [Puccinia graminis f. sp. tritici]|nr:hypothetical protein PGT21_006045 [Puccinia graminis f. sp. tritici]
MKHLLLSTFMLRPTTVHSRRKVLGRMIHRRDHIARRDAMLWRLWIMRPSTFFQVTHPTYLAAYCGPSRASLATRTRAVGGGFKKIWPPMPLTPHFSANGYTTSYTAFYSVGVDWAQSHKSTPMAGNNPPRHAQYWWSKAGEDRKAPNVSLQKHPSLAA